VVFASAYHGGLLTPGRRTKPEESRGFEALKGDLLPTRLGEEPKKIQKNLAGLLQKSILVQLFDKLIPNLVVDSHLILWAFQ
jgi:hypothetical protein